MLIVHGDRDEYFPADHAEQLFEAASQPKELWIVPGFGHAESAVSAALIDRIATLGAGGDDGRGQSQRRRLAVGEAPVQQPLGGGEAHGWRRCLVLSSTTPISSVPPRLASNSRQ